jgi:hypothetical protein
MGLKEIETSSTNFRGQCTICGRKSFRWGKWQHVEAWHKKHKCVMGRVNHADMISE